MRASFHVDGLSHGGQPIPNATRVGDIVVSGGIGGRSRTTGEMPEALADEVANCFANLEAVAEAAGISTEDIAKVTVYAVDRSVREHLNEHWLRLFPDEHSRPARHTLVQQLSGMRVQLEFLAVAQG
ncbi:RidA family protein [Ammonicoccus fulvus]|uniref:RidA family protein n=1 Tax=Ammonicoccus fulvus TaxID=3138240 RepID=A0ABZ3FJ76_9ACTN